MERCPMKPSQQALLARVAAMDTTGLSVPELRAAEDEMTTSPAVAGRVTSKAVPPCLTQERLSDSTVYIAVN